MWVIVVKPGNDRVGFWLEQWVPRVSLTDERAVGGDDEVVGQRVEGPPAAIVDAGKDAEIALLFVVPEGFDLELVGDP
jgi:hypothetical protein